MSSICVPQVVLSFCFQTLLYFENEHKGCLFYELDLENNKIFSLDQVLDWGH